MPHRGLHTEARIVAVALTTATLIGAVGTAAYVWGPLHEAYEEVCRLYPPLKTLGPAPLGILATLVLTGFLAALITLGRELLVARRLVHRLQAHMTGLPLQIRLLARDAGLEGRVLAIADDYPYAFCFGVLRPRICISTGMAGVLDEVELRAVVAHERSHLLRRDPLRLLVARVVKRALLLLPLSGELYRRYLVAREITADRDALAVVTREEMASALLKLLRGQGHPLVDAEGVAGFNVIEERIRYLEEAPSEVPLPPPSWRWGIGQVVLRTGATLLVLGFLGGISEASVFGCQI